MSSPVKRSTKSPAKSSQKDREHQPAKLIRGKVSESGLESMIKRKQNLINCFQIYQLLFQNNTPQKCIAHNNFVTLYCQNQHKLLCVNCIYGNSTHTNHKVVPIKNALKKIQIDNNCMKKHLRLYIDEIKTFEKNNQYSKEQSDSTLKIIMYEIEDHYNLAVNALEQKFYKLKQSVVKMFQSDARKMQVLMEQVSWMKEVYVQKQKSFPSSNQESEMLFSHIMLSTMLENDNLRESRIQNSDFTEMKISIQNQFKKIIDAILGSGGGLNQSSPVKRKVY